MNPNDVRFAADAMLQSLGKWLRLLGYDCAAESGLFGRRLLELAVAERRWILTRNLRFTGDMPLFLLSRADIHLVVNERLPDQLREVVERFSLEPSAFVFTRCLVCNEPLLVTAKSHAAHTVPPAVFEREDQFWRCSRCGRIYWQGSHVYHSTRRLHHWLDANGNNH